MTRIHAAPLTADVAELHWRIGHLSQNDQQLVLDAWQHGYARGVLAGRAAVEAEDEASWSQMRTAIRTAAERPDYAALAERRGQPKRARAARELLVERGVSKSIVCSLCQTPTSPWKCSCGETRRSA